MIAYKDLNGNVCICSDGYIPENETTFEVQPMQDRIFREALDIVAGVLVVDLVKGKNVVHDMRRAQRDEQMKPYDEIIALNIPGNDLVAAETARAAIRTANAAIQVSIDACLDETDLRTVITTNSL